MVNHLVAHLGGPVYIGFAGSVVASLYHINEETVNTVTVVTVILGGIDTPCEATLWALLGVS